LIIISINKSINRFRTCKYPKKQILN